MEASSRLDVKEVPCITMDGLTDAQRRAYVIADNKLALNAGWNEDLLRKELIGLKSTKFEMSPLRFDLKEKADLTVDREIDQPEYDESAADDIVMITYPKWGKSFP